MCQLLERMRLLLQSYDSVPKDSSTFDFEHYAF